MKELNIFFYIKKYRNWIIVISLLSGILFYFIFSNKQTYTASAIIKYTNDEATEGLAADGTAIDTSEIYSTEVMTRVFQKLNLNYDESNMDEIRSNVLVEPVLSEEDSVRQVALNEEGETLDEEPTMYMVSYTVAKNSSADSEKLANLVLNTMLSEYLEVYAENHVNSTFQPNVISGFYDGDYDYIEMVEILQESVDEALTGMETRIASNFRSSETGYSFVDINSELNLIESVDIAKANSYILENKVTKDQDILLAKYENRINDLELSNDVSELEVDGIENIISTYLDKMKESNNSDFTSDYILNDVYDRNYTTYNNSGTTETNEGSESGTQYEEADITTEYDVLMEKYAQDRSEFENSLIDAAYYRYIIDIFSGADSTSGDNSDETNNPVKAVEDGDKITLETDAEVETKLVSTEEEQNTAYSMVKEITDKVDSLFEILQTTNKEYNQYSGANNISVLTDTVTAEGINLKLYTMIAVILFGVVGCVMAVVIGRIYEIFEYYLYVDKNMGISNRTGCDRYVASYAKRKDKVPLTCVAIRVSNIMEKNVQYGRDACDTMIKDFSQIVKAVFSSNHTFVSINGLGQFVIFIENSEKSYAKACMKEVIERCMDYNKNRECKISYSCGISSSEEEEIYNARKLMIQSMAKAEGKIGARAS